MNKWKWQFKNIIYKIDKNNIWINENEFKKYKIEKKKYSILLIINKIIKKWLLMKTFLI